MYRAPMLLAQVKPFKKDMVMLQQKVEALQNQFLKEQRELSEQTDAQLRQFQQAKDAQIASLKQSHDRKVAELEAELKKLKSEQRQARIAAAGSPK